MGKASITIAVGALWNGSSELNKVNSDLKTMAARVAALDKSTTQSLALSGQSWESYGSKIYDAGKQISAIGDTLTQKVTVPMSVLGGYCVSQAVTFDSALADLNKTADLTTEQLDDFGKAALEASKTSPVTASEILQAEALGAQLGISTDKLKDFSDVANGLDIATDMDMETAATQMAQFANITDMSQDKLSNYGSTIVDLGNHLATTESDISAMSLRLAGLSATANFSQQEILGMAGAMSSLGINAEAGGSAMTQIVSTITKAVETGADSVQAYADVAGMSADEFSAAWRESPVQALEAVIDGIHNLDESGKATDVTLSELGITSIRQADVMRRLSGNTDVLHEALDRANTAWEENTALTTEVDKRNESLESRFQTLQNKVSATATEIGVPLAEALLDIVDDLEPVTSAIASACDAFADMDSGSQQTVLALAGVAAAAGPVLKVAGSLTQGIGNVVSTMGKVKTQAAIFGDAMNTVDGASMRVYASTDSAATKLGLAGNSAAKAAGGADKYVTAWEKMNDAAKVAATSQDKLITTADKLASSSGKTRDKLIRQVEALEKQRDAALATYESQGKLVSAYSGSTSEAAKAKTAAEKLTKAYGSGEIQCDKLIDALGNIADGYGDVVTEGAKGASTVKTAAESFKTAASNAGGLVSNLAGMAAEFVSVNAGAIAVGALTAAVGALIAAWAENEQRQKTFTEATSGLVSAANGATNAVEQESSVFDVLSGSVATAKDTVDSALESQAQLAETMRSTNTSALAQQAQLQDAYAAIQEYANQSDLSTEAQGRLKSAVETVNDLCGTQISVTDSANGKLSDEAGAIDNVSEKLGDYITKKLEQIRVDAQQQNLTSLYEQQAEDIAALAKAQKSYNDLLGDHDTYVQNYLANCTEVSEETQKLAEKGWESWQAAKAQESGLNDAKAALESCNTSISTVTTSLGAAVTVADGTAASVSSLAAASSTVSGAVGALGGDLSQFSADLEATGLSVESFKSLTDEQLIALVTSWDGTTDSISTILSDWGIQTTQTVTDTMGSVGQETQNGGQTAAENFAGGLDSANGSVKASSDAMADTVTDSTASLPSDMTSTGASAGQSLADSLLAKTGVTSGAGSNLASAANGAVSGLPGNYADTGRTAGERLSTGMLEKLSRVDSAAAQVGAAADSMKVDGSYGWGSDLTSNFASGISSGIGWVASAASAIAEKAASILHFTQPDEGVWSGSEKGGITSGMHLAQNFSEGMRLGISDVERSAALLSAAMAPSLPTYALSAAAGPVVPAIAARAATTGQQAQITNNNVYINGTQVNNLSTHAQELIGELFGEVGAVAGMR